jgi:hypothetical protein
MPMTWRTVSIQSSSQHLTSYICPTIACYLEYRPPQNVFWQDATLKTAFLFHNKKKKTKIKLYYTISFQDNSGTEAEVWKEGYPI